MESDRLLLLAITMGDPAGVGPEVVVGALSTRRVREACRALVIGDERTLREASESLRRRFRARVVGGVEEMDRGTSAVCLLDLHNADPREIGVGEVSEAAGMAAAAYIRRAVELAETGKVAGIVTAPINKEALRLAHVPYPGHTEMLAALCGAKAVAMMLIDGDMRVSHVTTHVSVREACELVRRGRVLEVIRLTYEALRQLGIARPRIAVAGLNPHAGESGLFGEEEVREIGPAVAQARDEGMQAFGPLPPDSVFARHRAGEFDGVVAMTHDQGHIAVKTVGFSARTARTARKTARAAPKTARAARPSAQTERGTARWAGAADPDGTGAGTQLRVGGVNVTLGLPIIRTSVDHGTAFDIAGQGIADSTSMVEAILLAAQMARGLG